MPETDMTLNQAMWLLLACGLFFVITLLSVCSVKHYGYVIDRFNGRKK